MAHISKGHTSLTSQFIRRSTFSFEMPNATATAVQFNSTFTLSDIATECPALTVFQTYRLKNVHRTYCFSYWTGTSSYNSPNRPENAQLFIAITPYSRAFTEGSGATTVGLNPKNLPGCVSKFVWVLAFSNVVGYDTTASISGGGLCSIQTIEVTNDNPQYGVAVSGQQAAVTNDEYGRAPKSSPLDIWQVHGFDQTKWNLFLERFEFDKPDPNYAQFEFRLNVIDVFEIEFSGISWATSQFSTSVSTMPFSIEPYLPHDLMGSYFTNMQGRLRPQCLEEEIRAGESQLLPSRKRRARECDDDVAPPPCSPMPNC